MKPEAGVRLTLVTRDLETPYSGMLPGVIAGLYAEREAHIDLLRLSAVTGTRLILAEAIGIDRGQKRVLLAGRRPSPTTCCPSMSESRRLWRTSRCGGARHAVKPIGSFLGKFAALRARCRDA
jgi:selenide,water dikinase